VTHFRIAGLLDGIVPTADDPLFRSSTAERRRVDQETQDNALKQDANLHFGQTARLSDEERRELIAGLMGVVGRVMKQHVEEKLAAHVAKHVAPITARCDAAEAALAELRAEIEALKASPQQSNVDRGVYRSGADYSAGDLVSHDGSYWAALNATRATPGESAGWRLVALRGKAGPSPYDLARRHGYRGSEREWLESLRTASPSHPRPSGVASARP
jgi:hypothetical protein